MDTVADETRDFAAKFKTAGGSCDFTTIQGGQHRVRDWERFYPGWAREVADWLQ